MELPSSAIDRIERVRGLVAAYVFGSRARGTAHPSSDLDVALWLADAPQTFDAYPFDLGPDLTDLLGVAVDVVVLNRAQADLVHRVLRDGTLIVERDRSRRIAFEVAARNQYFDMQPIWSAIRFPRRKSA